MQTWTALQQHNLDFAVILKYEYIIMNLRFLQSQQDNKVAQLHRRGRRKIKKGMKFWKWTSGLT